MKANKNKRKRKTKPGSGDNERRRESRIMKTKVNTREETTCIKRKNEENWEVEGKK